MTCVSRLTWWFSGFWVYVSRLVEQCAVRLVPGRWWLRGGVGVEPGCGNEFFSAAPVLADGCVEGLLIARILQGVGAGGATAAASSALIDFAPENSSRGEFVGTFIPGFAMAAGSLGCAALVQYGPQPTHLIWVILIVVLVLALVGVLYTAGRARRRPGALG